LDPRVTVPQQQGFRFISGKRLAPCWLADVKIFLLPYGIWETVMVLGRLLVRLRPKSQTVVVKCTRKLVMIGQINDDGKLGYDHWKL
jgi:hypothetical protein